MRAREVVPAMVAIFFIGLGNFPAHAEIVVTANDGKMVLENGSAAVRKQPLPDTVSVIDFTDGALKLLGEVPAPASVVGNELLNAIAPAFTLFPAPASTTVLVNSWVVDAATIPLTSNDPPGDTVIVPAFGLPSELKFPFTVESKPALTVVFPFQLALFPRRSTSPV